MINNEDDNELNKHIKQLNEERRIFVLSEISRLDKRIKSDFSSDGFYKGKDIKNVVDYNTSKLCQLLEQSKKTPILPEDEQQIWYDVGYQDAVLEAFQTREDAKQLVRLILKIWDDDVDL